MIPSFAVFCQLQNARASVRVSIRFVQSIFKKKVCLTDKSGTVVDWPQFSFGQSEQKEGNTVYEDKFTNPSLPLARFFENDRVVMCIQFSLLNRISDLIQMEPS